MTFDESTPCASPTLECAGDQDMSESIFVDGDLLAPSNDEDDPLLPTITPTFDLVVASLTPVEGPAASSPTLATFEPAPVTFEGQIISQREAC